VAGVAALIRSKYPNLSAAEVVHRLIATAIDKGPPGRDSLYGYGIVDPVAALTANVPPIPPSLSGASAHQSVAPHPRGVSVRVWLLVGLGVLGAIVIFGAIVVLRRRAES
jgi:subtilisin family serine protease